MYVIGAFSNTQILKWYEGINYTYSIIEELQIWETLLMTFTYSNCNTNLHASEVS